MRAGRLDKRITIQQNTEIRGTSGGYRADWSDFLGWISASVALFICGTPLATDKGGEISEMRTEFIIRYRPGITEQMRVSYAGKFYNIRHVSDVNESHDMLVLTCDTGVNDG